MQYPGPSQKSALRQVLSTAGARACGVNVRSGAGIHYVARKHLLACGAHAGARPDAAGLREAMRGSALDAISAELLGLVQGFVPRAKVWTRTATVGLCWHSTGRANLRWVR